MKDSIRYWIWGQNWTLGHHKIWVIILALLPVTLGLALVCLSVKQGNSQLPLTPMGIYW